MIPSNIEDIEREEALNLLCSLYTSWNSSWNSTAASLSSVDLSDSAKRRVHFYETEQEEAIISLLASLLVAWDREDQDSFSISVMSLAHELRPSLPYVELEPEETLALSPLDMSRLRNFIEHTSSLLKSTILDLRSLSSRRFRFNKKPLSSENAEALLREKLNRPRLDFREFA